MSLLPCSYSRSSSSDSLISGLDALDRAAWTNRSLSESVTGRQPAPPIRLLDLFSIATRRPGDVCGSLRHEWTGRTTRQPATLLRSRVRQFELRGRGPLSNLFSLTHCSEHPLIYNHTERDSSSYAFRYGYKLARYSCAFLQRLRLVAVAVQLQSRRLGRSVVASADSTENCCGCGCGCGCLTYRLQVSPVF